MEPCICHTGRTCTASRKKNRYFIPCVFACNCTALRNKFIDLFLRVRWNRRFKPSDTINHSVWYAPRCFERGRNIGPVFISQSNYAVSCRRIHKRVNGGYAEYQIVIDYCNRIYGDRICAIYLFTRSKRVKPFQIL